MTNAAEQFQIKKCIKFYLSHVKRLPFPYISSECIRSTVAFFSLTGLELLQSLDSSLENEKSALCDTIYSWLIPSGPFAGFRGGLFMGAPKQSGKGHEAIHVYDTSHISSTYVCLLMLVMLGDDLSRVPKDAILDHLCTLQTSLGTFDATTRALEADMRFLFCACAISFILNDWRGIDQNRAVEYIRHCTWHDGGISQKPGGESHAGSTYCAIAALSLMNRLDQGLVHRQRTERWLISRQLDGFQGRVGKDPDSCYAFWVSSPLTLLGLEECVDKSAVWDFLNRCQSEMGGFGKWPNYRPDIVHAYLTVAGMSLTQLLTPEQGLAPLEPRLNTSVRVYQSLLHNTIWHK